MSVRRVVLSSFVLIVLARATCAVADDPSDRAVLGRAVPIGNLLIVKAGFDDEPEPLPSDPIPLLEPGELSLPPGLLLAPAHFHATAGCAVMPATTRIDPNEIPFHLSQAIVGMTAAGLTEEAWQATALLEKFQTRHHARLLLAQKQSQLSELQAEIERIKLRVEKGILADRVSISIKIFETSETAVLKLLKESLGLPETGQTANAFTQPKTLSKQDIEMLIELLQDTNGVRILSSPRLIVLSGQTGEAHIGGKFTIPLLVPAGGSEERSFGTFVKASPTITDKDQIRLALTVDASELDMANAVTINNAIIPGLTRRRIRSTLELKDGQTVVLGGLISTRNEKTTETFITVMAEIVQPRDQSIDPIAPQPVPSPAFK